MSASGWLFLREKFSQSGLANSWHQVQEAGEGEAVSHHAKCSVFWWPFLWTVLAHPCFGAVIWILARGPDVVSGICFSFSMSKFAPLGHIINPEGRQRSHGLPVVTRLHIHHAKEATWPTDGQRSWWPLVAAVAQHRLALSEAALWPPWICTARIGPAWF